MIGIINFNAYQQQKPAFGIKPEQIKRLENFMENHGLEIAAEQHTSGKHKGKWYHVIRTQIDKIPVEIENKDIPLFNFLGRTANQDKDKSREMLIKAVPEKGIMTIKETEKFPFNFVAKWAQKLY